MPSKEHEALVEKVAKAINGPFHHVPEGSPYTLDQLRDIRWQQINDVERKLCLASAKAAISTIRAAIQEPNANQEQSGMREIMGGTGYVNHEIYIDPETPWHTWRAMLAASALGEQSE